MASAPVDLIRRARARGSATLDLSGCNEVELPPEIAELTDLEHLILDRSKIESIPAHIGYLRKLKTITARRSSVVFIADEIAMLEQLQTLDLSDCSLGHVPQALWSCTELIVLKLEGVREQKTLYGDGRKMLLSDGIGHLRKLRELWLGGFRIGRLPIDLESLRSLDILALRYTDLKEIPREVFALEGLRELHLVRNRIREIPRDIASLKGLRHLDVSQNKIRILPTELAQIEKLDSLDMRENPLADPFPELADRGTYAVLAYLRGLMEDGVPLYEIKAMLVGEGEVGKSSLVSALKNEPFVEGRATTHGIELHQLPIKHPTEQREITVTMWDFGGQEVYRITHQFFFSRRSLYLLVWKPRQGQSENSIEFWLRTITLRVGSEARIMIVATHGDERRPELDVPYLEGIFGRDLIAGQWIIDSSTRRGVASLQMAIAGEAAHFPQMGGLLSKRWLQVREHLRNLTEPQIPYARYEAICDAEGLDSLAKKTLIELLHDLGQVVYFSEDEGLRDVIVLQPEWLTKAIGYVLEDEFTRNNGGELSHDRLVKIWQSPTVDIWQAPPDRQRYPAAYFPYFLRLMEKFDVSYRIPDTNRSLIGQLVPYQRPAFEWQAFEGDGQELSMSCELSHEAPGLLAWLTVRTYRFSTSVHWRRGVLLEHKDYGSRALIELHDSRSLSLSVRAPSPIYMFSILRDTIEDLITRRWPGLTYDLTVQCSSVIDDDYRCRGRFKIRVLENLSAAGLTQTLCGECIQHVDITFLLTGFRPLQPTTATSLSHRVAQLDRIEQRVTQVSVTVAQLEAHAADAANDLRIIRRAIGREVADCPRMINVEQILSSALNPTRLFRRRMRLWLWCEHPGHEHRCAAPPYEVSVSREWLVNAAPYMHFAAQMLRLLPMAGAITGALTMAANPSRAAELTRLKSDIEAMHALANEFSSFGSNLLDSNDLVLEATGLRRFREVLFRLDKNRHFQGLRRVLTASGDYLWICIDHYALYDPGLPIIESGQDQTTNLDLSAFLWGSA